MTRATVRGRPGLSLLEVLAALAILLLAIVAVSSLLINAGQNAEQVHFQEEAVQIAQTKLAELVAGALPLTAQQEAPLDEDPAWSWAVECEQDSVANLYRVTVRVTRPKLDGTTAEYCSLSQLVLDPTQRGSTQDALALAASVTQATESGTTTPQQGTTPQSGSQTTTPSSTGGTSSGSTSTPSTPSTPSTLTPSTSRPSSGGSSLPSAPSGGSAPTGGSMGGGSMGGGTPRSGGGRD